MAKTALCISCEVEFPSEATYEKHKASEHMFFPPGAKPLREETKPRITLEKAEQLKAQAQLPPNVPQEALPSPEFIETIKRLEGDTNEPTIIDKEAIEKHKKEMEETLKNAPKPPEPKPPVPIRLTYLFLGECSEHRVPVTTFEVDAGGKHFAVCVCPIGREQLQEKEVVKLSP